MTIRRCHLLMALALGAGLCAVPARPAELAEIRALADEGRADRALEQLEKMLAVDPGDLEGRLLRGVLLVELDRPEDAERAFLELTRQHPDQPEPVNNLAVMRAASGRRATAIAALEEVVDHYPSYQVAAANLEQIRQAGSSTAFDPLRPDATRLQLLLTAELGSHPRVDPAPPTAATAAPAEKPSAQPPPAPEIEPTAPARPAPPPEPVAAPAPPPTETPPRPAEPAAPEPPGTAQPRAEAELRAELVEVVSAWAEAWSRQRIRDYLDFYAEEFRPAGDGSRAAWEEVRRQRLAAPEFIEVRIDLDSLTVRRGDDGEVSVTFTQEYRSDRFGDTVQKTLELVRQDGAWKIRRESGR